MAFHAYYTSKERLDEKYQDESYAYLEGTGRRRKEWISEDPRSFSKRPINKGKRVIISHTGGKNGFLEGAALVEFSVRDDKVQP